MKKENNLLEAFMENTEVVFDAFLNDEVAKSIPVVGTAFKILKGVDDIRNRLFAAKLIKFMQSPSFQSDEFKNSLKIKFSLNPEEAENVGEILMFSLDTLTDLKKPQILSKIFVSFVDGIIDLQQLKRLARAIELSFIDDLEMLILEGNTQTLSDDARKSMLGTGFFEPNSSMVYGEFVATYYSYTELANVFKKCIENSN